MLLLEVLFAALSPHVRHMSLAVPVTVCTRAYGAGGGNRGAHAPVHGARCQAIVRRRQIMVRVR